MHITWVWRSLAARAVRDREVRGFKSLHPDFPRFDRATVGAPVWGHPGKSVHVAERSLGTYWEGKTKREA